MFSKLKNSLVFRLEQIVVRGPLWRFGLMLVVVVFVALVGGLLTHAFASGFESTGDAIWWAFLRLTDPGYLGDDEELVKGTVSTALTILGAVIFTGALIAILVQWLGETMDRLELGLTPVSLEAHIVLAGWTSRTLTILEEILVSEGRVERFLRRRGARRLYVALLTERADASLRQEMKLQLGPLWNARRIILRSGSPLRLDDLERVDLAHAGAILIPATDTSEGNALDADTHTVKTLLTMGAVLEERPSREPPLVVVEIQDTRYVDTLRAVYPGPMEIIAGDEVISRLLVQTVRHPGLSHVYAEFLSDMGGSQIHVREEPRLTGTSVQQLAYAFPEGVLLGLVRPDGEGFKALLNPPNDLLLEPGDRIAVLAPSHEDATPSGTPDSAFELHEKPAPTRQVRARRRVLVLGWNHRVPALLREFASYSEERFAIDIVSQISAAKREKRTADAALSGEQVRVRQLEFDYTAPAYLESLDPAGYDNVVLLPSERLKSGTESDARTIMGCLLLRGLSEGGSGGPSILVELRDPDNGPLFENRGVEVIVSPVIVSHMLARVALRRELRAVLDELFSSDGCEISFRRLTDYDLVGGEHTFGDVQRAVDARGEIAIGLRRAAQKLGEDGGVRLNPGRDETLQLHADDELIVLTTYT